jgi:PAS domain S-box-containing protein
MEEQMATAPTNALPRPPAAVRLIRPLPRWAWVLVGATLAVLVLECVTETGNLGSGDSALDLQSATYLSLMWTAAIFALAGAWARRDLGCWGLIAIGLVVTAMADTYFQFYVDPISGPYPSVADYLYFLSYVLIILGLRNLGRRSGGGRIRFQVLLTPLLGVATIWWWIALNPVAGTLEGTTAARLTTIAYPALDLLLICSVLVTLAAVGWRAGPSLALLIAGAVSFGVADSVYAAQVAAGSFPDLTLINALWPIGSLLMAAAAWLADRPDVAGEPSESRLELFFALGAIAIALIVLIWDHFDRFSPVAVVLAGLTVAAASARLVLLYFETVRARREALVSERERGWIEGVHTTSVAAALDCVITVDPDGNVVGWNPAAARTFGYRPEDALGKNVAALVVPESLREEFADTFARLAAGNNVERIGERFESVARRSDGVEIPIEMAFTRTEGEPPTFTAIINDISQRKHREEERDRLAAMVISAQDAMVSADLDGTILTWNPAAERIYGYAAAEIVGTRLTRLTPEDRMGEVDELRETVLRGETTSMETQRVRKDGGTIDVSLQVFPVRDERGTLTGYSGVSRDITDRRRREEEDRRNRERQAWRREVEDALDHDGLEFVRQPILDLHSGRITHHELLLRLRMDGKLVAPDRFLPHAEGSPLMRRIDRWAIRQGIALAAERPVAINLSATSLSDAGIVRAVEAALGESGTDARDVSFEITETAAAEDLDAASSLVGALRGLGCPVALDDFGTGYGSFTYLARLPVTRLKIDMSFIRKLSEKPDDQRVVRSIVAVAQNFGLTTIGEGVEDERCLELLRSMDVDEAQGYLIGRPAEAWIEEADLPMALRPSKVR